MAYDVVYSEDFTGVPDGGMPVGWWVEGGQSVGVEDGRLRVRANPPGRNKPGYVCTVWYAQPFAGDLRVEFDAHVVDSTIGANNINFFLLYSHPDGGDLHATRETRSDGSYSRYHDLNGYIFTFLNDFHNEREGEQARMRMRRCPGFELITETYAYHCRKGTTYRVSITKSAGELSLAVDGKVYLEGKDTAPWSEGLIGLRTFQTDLWWDNIVVKRAAP